MIRPHRFWTGLALAVLLAAPLRSEENTWLPAEPGKVAVVVNKWSQPRHKLNPGEAASYTQNLTRLKDLILARPLLQNPIGATLKGYFRANDEPGNPRLPVPGFAYIRFHPMMKDWHTGQPVAFIVSTWEIEARINVPTAGLELMNELEVPLYLEPKPVGESEGHPFYTVGGGSELMVFTRSGRVPWVPVSRGEYADLVVAHWKKLAQDANAVAALKPFIDKYEAWRAAMTPGEKALQALHGMENGSEVQFEKRPLVKLDPAWYDPALPRSAFQTIHILFDYSGDLDFRNPKNTQNPAPLRVWEALHESAWNDLTSALTAR